MKKTISMMLLGVSIMFTAVSCEKNRSIQDAKTEVVVSPEYAINSYYHYDFDNIGIEHNTGIQFIYNALSSQKIHTLSVQAIDYIILNQTNQILVNNSNLAGFDPAIIGQISPGVGISGAQLLINLENDLYTHVTSSLIEGDLNIIESIINNYITIEDYDVDQFIGALRDVEQDLDNQMPQVSEAEYLMVKATIVTAIYSIQYWEANFDDWQSMIPASNKDERGWGWFKSAIGRMAKADAYGAGVGAVVGFVTTAATGPGVIVGTAAGAVGYGLNSSGIQGVRILFE